MLPYNKYEALRDRCVKLANLYASFNQMNTAFYWLNHRKHLYFLMYERRA